MRGDRLKYAVLAVVFALYATAAICTHIGWNNILSNRTIRRLLFKPMKVGVIYVDPYNVEYYIVHDDAMDAASRAVGQDKIKLVKKAQVPAGSSAINVMENMIRGGCELIFAGSYDYQDDVLKVAKRHPDIYFAVAGGDKLAPNVSCYWGRTYQTRYLTGILAGLTLDKDKSEVGYVASYKHPHVMRDINAFTLGARSVNKGIKVKVRWANTWHIVPVCRKAALTLLDDGVDMMAQHVDPIDPAIVALQRGKYAIGHGTDFEKSLHNPNILVSAIWDWTLFMTEVMQSVLDGNWQSQLYWGSLKDGVVKLTEFSSKVKQSVRDQVLDAAREIEQNDKVFCGEIYDNQGVLRQVTGKCMTDSQLLEMDWFVAGVEETNESVGLMPR